jgi:hypothetical protein
VDGRIARHIRDASIADVAGGFAVHAFNDMTRDRDTDITE